MLIHIINKRFFSTSLFDTESVILKHKQQLNKIKYTSTKMNEPKGANLTPTTDVYKTFVDLSKNFSGQTQDY